jgi:hypothetical protein
LRTLGAWLVHFTFAFVFSARLGSMTGLFLFLLNAKPINPRATKAAPATISQWGNCIAESIVIPAE